VPVTINGVTDADGDPLNIVVTEVRQDEQPQFMEPAMTCGDARGVGTSTVSLAAKRLGSGDGRVYHLLVTADDGGGGMCQKTVQVCVPHDQANGSCIDQGALFDSVSSCK
jgi:hypothetical protein